MQLPAINNYDNGNQQWNASKENEKLQKLLKKSEKNATLKKRKKPIGRRFYQEAEK